MNGERGSRWNGDGGESGVVDRCGGAGTRGARHFSADHIAICTSSESGLECTRPSVAVVADRKEAFVTATESETVVLSRYDIGSRLASGDRSEEDHASDGRPSMLAHPATRLSAGPVRIERRSSCLQS